MLLFSFTSLLFTLRLRYSKLAKSLNLRVTSLIRIILILSSRRRNSYLFVLDFTQIRFLKRLLFSYPFARVVEIGKKLKVTTDTVKKDDPCDIFKESKFIHFYP